MLKELKEDMKTFLNSLKLEAVEWNEENSSTVQHMKVEIESIKNAQAEENWEMKNLGTQSESSEASHTNRIQEMEERCQA